MSFDYLPERILVDVDFYDEIEKDKLKKYATYERIEGLVKTSNYSISINSFLSYFLFHKKKLNNSNWNGYNDIAKNCADSLVYLKDCIIFNQIHPHDDPSDINYSIIIDPNSKGNPENAISEHIGEGIGLSVISDVHELIQADWDIIEIDNKISTFDYSIDISDQLVVQVENKGHAVDNNQLKTGVSDSKTNIIKKKPKLPKIQIIHILQISDME